MMSFNASRATSVALSVLGLFNSRAMQGHTITTGEGVAKSSEVTVILRPHHALASVQR